MKKIEVKNLSKSFKKQPVLKNINISLVSNKIYGFSGRNGSGKSVLLKILCGLLKPDSGQVIYNGNILKDDIYKYNVGALIETPKFFANLTGYENLEVLANIKKQINSTDINNALKVVCLYEEKDKKYGKYSLGMKQKLGIAQAIMENQEIIFLDEAFNGVEASTVKKLKEYLLKEKVKDKIIVISSHIEDDLIDICDTIYYFEEGTICEESK